MVSQRDPDASHSLTVRGAQSVVGTRSSARPHASSRSKRYNRSHAGGTSYIPQNEFPWFSASGDVEIVIKAGGKENRYLLHRHTLTRCSGFFEASTSQQWSKATILPPLPEPPSRDLARIGEDSGVSMGGKDSTESHNELTRPGAGSPGPRRRWRYELDPGTGRDDIPMLIQKEADSSGGGALTSANPAQQTGSIFGGGTSANTSSTRHKHSHSATHATSSFFRSVANLSLPSHHHSPNQPPADDGPPLSQADVDLLRDYDNLFRVFYNYPPVLDGINIADAYVQCKSLLTLADQYDALAVCGPRVDHHLLQFQSRLWKQIAKYPVSYLKLGYLARSKVIFQEALIHVVGQWPAGERSIRSALPEIVLDIIEDKVDELEETISRIEGRLFRLNLTNSRGERVTPGTSYLDWLAVSFFRQWLADNTTPAPPPPPAPDRRGGSSSANRSAPVAPVLPSLATVGRTYRMLGSPSGAVYLTHDECKRFLKLTPDLYSRDNLRRFEKRIDEMKNAARELVRPLMGTGLELELSNPGKDGTTASPVGYLTCVRVVERDLPWSVED
ncbi:putative BTB domain-containing protein [Seiridium cardinale]